MPIYWRLKQFLEAQDITPYKLAKEAGVSLTTIYALVNPKNGAGKINSEVVDALLLALARLTGREVRHEDVLKLETPHPEATLGEKGGEDDAL